MIDLPSALVSAELDPSIFFRLITTYMPADLFDVGSVAGCATVDEILTGGTFPIGFDDGTKTQHNPSSMQEAHHFQSELRMMRSYVSRSTRQLSEAYNDIGVASGGRQRVAISRSPPKV